MAVNQKWSLQEKQKLADLLVEYPLNAYTSIAKRLKTKDADQVKYYIEDIRLSVKKQASRGASVVPVKKAPLDQWACMIRDLVRKENFDCSTHLSKIMSIISQFEDVPEGDTTGWTPNYRAIYKFLASVLSQDHKEDIETPGALESAVILDILYKLYDMLNVTDTKLQRTIMCWKYSLLDHRDEYGDPDYTKLRQAANNDFKDFIDDQVEQEICGYKKKRNKKHKKTPVIDPEPISSPSPVDSSMIQESSMAIERPFTPLDSSSQVTVHRHRPGKKCKNQPPEQPITSIVYVMPPKNTMIVNTEPRKKSAPKDREDGKYASLTDSEDKIINDCKEKQHKLYIDIKTSEVSDFIEKDVKTMPPLKPSETPVIIMPEAVPRTSVGAVREGQRSERKRKYEELKTNLPDNTPLKKPKLYAINPLCVPVKVLNLNLDFS